jgi:hypothetical protein
VRRTTRGPASAAQGARVRRTTRGPASAAQGARVRRTTRGPASAVRAVGGRGTEKRQTRVGTAPRGSQGAVPRRRDPEAGAPRETARAVPRSVASDLACLVAAGRRSSSMGRRLPLRPLYVDPGGLRIRVEASRPMVNVEVADGLNVHGHVKLNGRSFTSRPRSTSTGLAHGGEAPNPGSTPRASSGQAEWALAPALRVPCGLPRCRGGRWGCGEDVNASARRCGGHSER